MTIKSGGVFSGNSISIKSNLGTEAKTTSGMSGISSRNVASNASSKSAMDKLQQDVANIDGEGGVLYDYVNPDLETVLSLLGFSLLKPSMIGAFEFKPFIIFLAHQQESLAKI